MTVLELYSYIRTHPSITALIGTNTFLIQADLESKMPWLIVEVTSGKRTQITNTYTEEISFARFTVDVGPADTVKGSTIIEATLRAVENYRGLLGTMTDVHITCSAIRSWAGYSNVNRYQFDATIRSIETTQYPT